MRPDPYPQADFATISAAHRALLNVLEARAALTKVTTAS
jgi:hypothetical protein